MSKALTVTLTWGYFLWAKDASLSSSPFRTSPGKKKTTLSGHYSTEKVIAEYREISEEQLAY